MLQAPVDPGATYVVEFSTNLRDWQAIATPLNVMDGTLNWLDNGPPKTPSSTLGGYRFYRLRELDEHGTGPTEE